MTKSVKAIVDENGTVRVLEPLRLDRPTPAVITLLDEDESLFDAARSATAVLSEEALADWNKPEEDEAWAHLQPGR